MWPMGWSHIFSLFVLPCFPFLGVRKYLLLSFGGGGVKGNFPVGTNLLNQALQVMLILSLDTVFEIKAFILRLLRLLCAHDFDLCARKFFSVHSSMNIYAVSEIKLLFCALTGCTPLKLCTRKLLRAPSQYIGLTGVVNCLTFADPPTLAPVLSVYLMHLKR